MKTMHKTIMTGLIALFFAALTAFGALAAPYDGVQRIGTYYQYSNTQFYDYSFQEYHSYYPVPARQSGWYGGGVEWLTGLRPGITYTPGPIRSAWFWEPTCNWPNCYTGVSGYPRMSYDYQYRGYQGGWGSY